MLKNGAQTFSWKGKKPKELTYSPVELSVQAVSFLQRKSITCGVHWHKTKHLHLLFVSICFYLVCLFLLGLSCLILSLSLTFLNSKTVTCNCINSLIRVKPIPLISFKGYYQDIKLFDSNFRLLFVSIKSALPCLRLSFLELDNNGLYQIFDRDQLYITYILLNWPLP